MEKISRILPPSRRVVATDVTSSQPLRPGAPDFGRRPQSSPRLGEVQDRVSMSSLANSRSPEPMATYKNTKEGARAKVVEEMAEKFFNPRTVAKEGEAPLSEEALKQLNATREMSPPPTLES